ncbi:OsmC family protein [Salmonella enterica subsp. enterica]|nr:OsmC family protein [Salmonella enterica subsp. enterica]
MLNQQPWIQYPVRGAQKGTNPEELIGAAHTACFSMALSLMLGRLDLRRHPLTPPLTYRLIRWRRASPLPKSTLQSKVAVANIDASTFRIKSSESKSRVPVSRSSECGNHPRLPA